MKKCIDCKWVDENSLKQHNGQFSKCIRRVLIKQSGTQKAIGLKVELSEPEYSGWLNLQRSSFFPFYIFDGTCGRRGRWWEPKDPLNQLKDHVERNNVNPY